MELRSVKTYFVIVFALLTVSQITASQSIKTASILARSVSLDCLNWRISGVCVWLKCTIFGCFVVASPKISHRLPDFVVSAYPYTGKPPWVESKMILSALLNPLNSLLTGGSRSGITTDSEQHDSLRFNEVDIIGHPIIHINRYSKFLCRSDAKALVPYYLSIVDALSWRTGLPDSARKEAISIGMREIGNWPEFTWGNIFPRSGFVEQQHSGKAAAVASQRAIDVLLNDSKGHILLGNVATGKYTTSRGGSKYGTEADCKLNGGKWEVNAKNNDTGSCSKQVWYQWTKNSSENTDQWQMVFPNPSKQCKVFGNSVKWPFRELAESGAYMWNFWRDYSCCVKAGDILLFETNF